MVYTSAKFLSENCDYARPRKPILEAPPLELRTMGRDFQPVSLYVYRAPYPRDVDFFSSFAKRMASRESSSVETATKNEFRQVSQSIWVSISQAIFLTRPDSLHPTRLTGHNCNESKNRLSLKRYIYNLDSESLTNY